MRLLLCTLMLHACACNIVFSQGADSNFYYPRVGGIFPDLKVRNVTFVSKKSSKKTYDVDIKEFRGKKWVLIDFWNTHCSMCIASFPYTSRMVKEMGDKLQILVVGIEDPENKIRKMYDKFRQKQGLRMDYAFDSVLANRLDIGACPYVILIDDKGLVRSITTSIGSADIQGFMAGAPPTLLNKAYRDHEDEDTAAIAFDKNKPLLVNGNGATEEDVLYRSVVTKWNPTKHHVSIMSSVEEGVRNGGRFEVLGVTLQTLFQYAYLGQMGWSKEDLNKYGLYWSEPVLNVSDSSVFRTSGRYGQNIFSYSLIMPPKQCTKEKMETTMRKDLESYFGYTASIDTILRPYYKFVAKDRDRTIAMLRSKGGEYHYDGIPKASFKAKNMPFKNLFDLISGLNSGVFFDSTGIDGNIDIEMDCILNDMADVNKALKPYGLEFQQCEKEMAALVIRDYDPSSSTARLTNTPSNTADKSKVVVNKQVLKSSVDHSMQTPNSNGTGVSSSDSH